MSLENETQEREPPQTDEDAAAAALWAEFEEAESQTVAEAGSEEPPEGRSEDNAEGEDGHDREQARSEPQSSGTDIWANAPKELREEFERTRTNYEHRVQSDAGRIRALQRRLQTSQPVHQTAGQRREASAFFQSETWANYERDYPELAAVQREFYEHLGIDDLKTQVASVATTIESETQDAVDAHVEEKHPGWVDYLTEHRDQFQAWVESQPRMIREAVERNAQVIQDPEEAIRVLDDFKAHIRASDQSANRRGGSPPRQEPNRLEGRRRAQLEAGSASRRGGAPAVTSVPDDGDDEALWNYWAEYEKRQERRA